MDDDLLARALAGEARALARLMSLLERDGAAAARLVATLHPRAGRARVIGLTGAPGVGKSTLTGCLVRHHRAAGRRVGVIAVDPTSPFSGGALLGDRIRMVEHFEDPGVFIRSMATRGHLGGLAAATADVADLLDAAGYHIILVETIGVGQDDVEVARLVDVCVLVLTPGQGDDVQIMKGGIMEIGDVYAINKADQAGVDRLQAALEAALAVQGLVDERPVLRTIASSDQGIDALITAIDETESRLGGEAVARRRRERARERIEQLVRARLARLVERQLVAGAAWESAVDEVVARRRDPHAAAAALLAAAGIDMGSAQEGTEC